MLSSLFTRTGRDRRALRWSIALGLLAPNLACNCGGPTTPTTETCGSASSAMPSDVRIVIGGTPVEEDAVIDSSIGGQGSPMFVTELALVGVSSGDCVRADVTIHAPDRSFDVGYTGDVRADVTDGNLTTRSIFMPYSGRPSAGQRLVVDVTASGVTRSVPVFFYERPRDAGTAD